MSAGCWHFKARNGSCWTTSPPFCVFWPDRWWRAITTRPDPISSTYTYYSASLPCLTIHANTQTRPFCPVRPTSYSASRGKSCDRSASRSDQLFFLKGFVHEVLRRFELLRYPADSPPMASSSTSSSSSTYISLLSLPCPPPPCPCRTFLACLILVSKSMQDRSYFNRARAKLAGLSLEGSGCERALGDALDWQFGVGRGASTPGRNQLQDAGVKMTSGWRSLQGCVDAHDGCCEFQTGCHASSLKLRGRPTTACKRFLRGVASGGCQRTRRVFALAPAWFGDILYFLPIDAWRRN